jgi:hypothetical protein
VIGPGLGGLGVFHRLALYVAIYAP